jgi:hypothetical protein
MNPADSLHNGGRDGQADPTRPDADGGPGARNWRS